MVIKDKQGQTAVLDFRDFKAMQVRPGQTARLLARRVRQVFRVSKGHKVSKEIQALRAFKVFKEKLG
jgi:hypothetical protein